MVHYYLGDEPGEHLDVTPASVPGADAYDDVLAEATAPSGALTILTADWQTDAEGRFVRVTLDGLVLNEPGLWTLTLTLAQEATGATRQAMPVRIPVDDPSTGWHSIDTARADWQGAPEDDARLHDLLMVARDQVIEYAPALEPGVTAPVRYRAAQLMQARNIHNAQQIDPNTQTYGGPDGFTVRVYPLDWAVKQMLRPTRAVPVVA